ncbi:putative reverse transcriptase domain-containing protein, partial [Tanacetum coccineum]
YDGKGGAIALTRWIKKMESVFDNSGCAENQRVMFAASSFSEILRDGILIDEAVSCGALTKGNEKRKGVEETSKPGGSWKDNKKAKVGTVAPVKVVRIGYNQRVCYEYGSHDHLRNTCPKMHRAPGQAGNPLALEGNRNTRNNGNPARGRAFNINAVDALQDPNVVTEVADGRTRKFLVHHRFDTVGHESFDVIVGMDWLSKNKVVIVCHEKVVEIPLEGCGILQVQGERTLGSPKP